MGTVSPIADAGAFPEALVAAAVADAARAMAPSDAAGEVLS